MFAGPAHYVQGLPMPGRCLVMGVVNVTPDSFSDGGRWFEPDAAVLHAIDLIGQGADLIDVGGESTRPGAERPSVEDELARVMPVIDALIGADALVTIDTMRASVARRAVDVGAVAVNDVSGGLADEEMLATVAELGVPFISMHWRGHAASMHTRATYVDVVAEVRDELAARVAAAMAAGVRRDRLAVDPGLGFAKTGAHNWTLLRRLAELHSWELPIILGASRKAFLGTLLADERGAPRPASDRDDASATLSALAALSGAWCVRVHDVRRSRDAVIVAARYARESGAR